MILSFTLKVNEVVKMKAAESRELYQISFIVMKSLLISFAAPAGRCRDNPEYEEGNYLLRVFN